MKISLSFSCFKPFTKKEAKPTHLSKIPDHREKEAIREYTMLDYSFVNDTLRNKHNQNDLITHTERKKIVELIDSGVTKLAAKNRSTEKTFRGTSEPYNSQPEGSFYSERSFLSTSREKHVAEKFQGLGGQFSVIFGKSGADLVKHKVTFLPTEAEVLYPRNTEFQVLFRNDAVNGSKVVLEEKGLAQLPFERKRRNVLLADTSPAMPPIDPKEVGQSWGQPSNVLDVLNLDLHQPEPSKKGLPS